jgi:hypothetical protein
MIVSEKNVPWSVRSVWLFGNHPAGKREVERPRGADRRIKQSAERLHIHHQAEPAVDAEREDAVEREEIRRERDEEVVPVRDDVTALAADPELAHASAHEQHPERVRYFMPKT